MGTGGGFLLDDSFGKPLQKMMLQLATLPQPIKQHGWPIGLPAACVFGTTTASFGVNPSTRNRQVAGPQEERTACHGWVDKLQGYSHKQEKVNITKSSRIPLYLYSIFFLNCGIFCDGTYPTVSRGPATLKDTFLISYLNMLGCETSMVNRVQNHQT